MYFSYLLNSYSHGGIQYNRTFGGVIVAYFQIVERQSALENDGPCFVYMGGNICELNGLMGKI